MAYKFFFYGTRWRRMVWFDIFVFVAVGTLFHLAQSAWGHSQAALLTEPADHFSIGSVKNLFRYLVLMAFPIQNSSILKEVPAWIAWFFNVRYAVTGLISLAIVSFSFFGFVFGNRAVRFFIAWTFITLLPFTGYTASGNWMNLTHLYLTSIGFCVILAAGAFGCSGLLIRRRWRRWLPYAIPLAFVLVSLGLTHELDRRNHRLADEPRAREALQPLHEVCIGEEADRPGS